MKKKLSALLALVMVLSLCVSAAFAAPAPAPTKESDDYTGPVIDYEDKELWFKSDIYGGFYSAYQILKSNGDQTFDIDKFINSKQGELILSRIKYELCLLGDSQVASQTMIDYWASRGIIETPYGMDNIEDAWITYVPDYVYAEENAGKVYPVVFCQHGGGGTLFEATDHGFVDICYDEGFIVVVADNAGSDKDVVVERLPQYLDKMEELGYPIDRTRIYMGGMSLGGGCTLTAGIMCSDILAAIAPHSSSYTLMLDGVSVDDAYLSGGYRTMTGNISQADIDACSGMPMYLQIGTSDMNQIPLRTEVIDGLNAWLKMNDCPTEAVATDENVVGVTADKVYTVAIDGTNYTFAEWYNTDGVKTMVVVAVEGLPHWVSYSYSKLAWDFMSQYSLVDGQRVYTAKTPTYYNDVNNDADCAAAVQAVTEAGLMKGVDVNTFAPEGIVTRSQVITVLGRLANAVPTDISGVADVKPGSWYSGYVGWAVANGIVELKDGRFDPDGTLTGTELDAIFAAYAELTGVDYINFPAYSNMSPAPVNRGELAVRLVRLMNAPVDYDYADKELWYDTTLYGGFYSPYQIFMGNGDSTFDMPAFVNSVHGEEMMSRIKYELALLGDKNWSAPEMIEHWASLGVTQKAYNVGTTTEWLAYIPDYIEPNSTESWPVVFCFHGGGGTLFEATNHGFVDLCYEQGFIVIVPENENTNNRLCLSGLTDYVAVLEREGYKIDHDRIYTSGMSMGGMASMYCAVKGADIVAASTAQGCAGYGLLFGEDSLYGDSYLTLADFEKATEDAPMYFLVGDHEMAHQIPLTDGALAGLNTWLKMNGCSTAERADNGLGFTADRIYDMEIDGTTYTFAEFDNAEGELSVVFVGIENWVHWTPYSYARLSWNFMSRFTNK